MCNLKNLLKDSTSFVILTHERPDGDAISSSLAVYWYLMKEKSDSSEIDIVIPEFSRKFSFLPGFENIKTEPSKEHYDMLIVVDVSEPHRIKGFDKVSNRCSMTICFDHHEGFALRDCNHFVVDSSEQSLSIVEHKQIIKDILENVKTDVLVLAIENDKKEWKFSMRSMIDDLDLI